MGVGGLYAVGGGSGQAARGGRVARARLQGWGRSDNCLVIAAGAARAAGTGGAARAEGRRVRRVQRV
eukprot:scaffold87476_cov79-Phaeocystis_antarctica.AAC.5